MYHLLSAESLFSASFWYHQNILYVLLQSTRPNIEVRLKVRKSQMQFLEFSILPKNEWKTIKIIPRALMITFFPFFVRFLGEFRITKITYEICWPLINVKARWKRIEFLCKYGNIWSYSLLHLLQMKQKIGCRKVHHQDMA